MVAKTRRTATSNPAAAATPEADKADKGGKADKPARRTPRRAAGETGPKPPRPTPSFVDSQRELPRAAKPAEPQRPEPEVAAAAGESSFEAGLSGAAQVVGQAYGAVRDGLRVGADAVHDLSKNETVRAGTEVVMQHKGTAAVVIGAAVVGAPVVVVSTALAIGRTLMHRAKGQDTVDAMKTTYGELNDLANDVTAIPGKAKRALTSWAERLGVAKKPDAPAAKPDEKQG
jgi:hypothetical protein